MGVSLVWNLFRSCCLKDCLFTLNFCHFNYNISWRGFIFFETLCASKTLMSLSFLRLENFSAIISLIYLLALSLLFQESLQSYNVWVLDIVPEILLIFKNSFSFCWLVIWKSSGKDPICSSVLTNLFIDQNGQKRYSCNKLSYWAIQFQHIRNVFSF